MRECVQVVAHSWLSSLSTGRPNWGPLRQEGVLKIVPRKTSVRHNVDGRWIKCNTSIAGCPRLFSVQSCRQAGTEFGSIHDHRHEAFRVRANETRSEALLSKNRDGGMQQRMNFVGCGSVAAVFAIDRKITLRSSVKAQGKEQQRLQDSGYLVTVTRLRRS